MNKLNKLKQYFDLQKPHALPWGEWDIWRDKTKNERPLAYFVMETVPEKFEDFVKFFTRPVNELRYAIRMRIFDRYHIINTGLKPGYADCDTRMIHGMFNMLVDFVELEKAWMHMVFDKDARKTYKSPWWSLGMTRFKSFRSPDAGVAHLNWEMTLDSPDLDVDQQDLTQASTAREVYALYNWWKNIRPNRPDPHVESGWVIYIEMMEQRGKNMFNNLDETPEERQQCTDILERSREIETSYETEDDEMLIRLVKIRKYLWT